MNRSAQLPERARGRPADTDQQDLKKQILDTAEVMFADNGYAATSIRHIADRSGVNPALVHYYFGQKKGLLQSVLERAVEPLGKAIAAMKNAPGAAPESIAGLLISMAAAHPNMPRLLLREVILPGGEMQQYFVDNWAPRLGGALPALLDREKAAGRMRADADPAVAALLLIAISIFPFVARSLAEPVLGIRYDEAGIAFLKQQITQLLRQGMTR